MKKIRIATGVKRIEDHDHNATLFKLRDILNEHRAVLITRLVSDLAAYVDYRFNKKPSARELEIVKDALYDLKNSVLDLERYGEITEHFFANEMTYIGSELFLKEIDENISTALNDSQLKLV
jgi:hypothetical protein